VDMLGTLYALLAVFCHSWCQIVFIMQSIN
jgi:hypothetical protein